MTYEYEKLSPGERQYDDYDLTETTCVPARYVKAVCSTDSGNPFIEALPSPRDFEEVCVAYTKPLTDFDYERIKAMSPIKQQISVTSLRSLRYMLPFHPTLEVEFHTALLNSYRNRHFRYFNDEQQIIQNDKKYGTHLSLQGKVAAAANAGCTLLGYSGCGKSSALEILLSNYPQVIEHRNEKYHRFTQIVYLEVVCPANSNFSALYNSIGAEIDKVLGNITPIYEEMIQKKRTLAEKATIVCKLIDIFGIGCLIFDEIQLIDFQSQKENTFESLLTIVNQTKVALFAVGTEDAYQKMFPNLRTSRRTGPYINANLYCQDRLYFSAIVKNLMRYQWFDQYIPYSQEIADAFYDVTSGIVDQLIAVYMYVQIDYLRELNKPMITPNYIRSVSQKYFPEMKNLLDRLGDPEIEAQRQALMRIAKQELEQDLQIQQQKEAAAFYAKKATGNDLIDRANLRGNVIKNVQNSLATLDKVYNMSKIEKAVDHVMQSKANANDSEIELSKKAFKRLESMASDKRYVPKTAVKSESNIIDMRNILNRALPDEQKEE